MTISTMLLVLVIAATPAPSDGTAIGIQIEMPGGDGFVFEISTPPEPVVIDFDMAIAEATIAVVHGQAAADGWAEAQQPDAADDGRSFFTMLYQDTYDPAALTYIAASVFEMYTASDLRNQCEASEVITCSDPWPSTVQMDAMLTAGVYAGVIGLQRLAKTQWDVDLDEGWKSLLIWGGIAAGRALVAASNMSDANALREFGR